MYITAIFTHLVLEMCKNNAYDIRLRLRLTLQTRISCICCTPGLPERNFCNGLEMKLRSQWGGIQQAGVPKTSAKSVAPHFYLRLMITSG